MNGGGLYQCRPECQVLAALPVSIGVECGQILRIFVAGMGFNMGQAYKLDILINGKGL